MKKALLTVFAALAALSAPAAAQAQDHYFNPYIGFDLLRYDLSYDKYDLGNGRTLGGGDLLADNLNGLNLHVGNRFNRHFGMELGYFRTQQKSKDVNVALAPAVALTGNTKLRLEGVTLDALGYAPVHERFDLIGTAGVSWTRVKYNANIAAAGVAGNLSDSDREFNFRLGGGAQFNLSDNVNLRGLVRWQRADFDDTVDNAWVYSVGLNYSF